MAVDRREELALGNAQDRGRLEGDRRGRKALPLEERDGSDRLAHAEEPENDVALRRRLDDLHAADHDEAQVRRGLPLAKDLLALLVHDDPGDGSEKVPLLRVQALKKRDGVEVGKGGRRHGRSIERDQEVRAGSASGERAGAAAGRGRSVATSTWAQSRSPAVARIPLVPTRR